MGGIGYLAATEPPFPNYIFHGEIDGEHIALYRGKLRPIEDLQGHKSPYLVLEVTLADKTAKDAHPAIYNESLDIIENFLLEQPMNRSKHPTTFYIGKPDQLLGAEIFENGIRKGPVKDMAQARIKFEDYLRKIREIKPDVSLAGL